MVTYSVVWKKTAQKELKKIDKKQGSRIIEAVAKLSENPRPEGCKKLVNSESAYRIRIGNYRVIYQIEDITVTVEIVRVGHRQSIYKLN